MANMAQLVNVIAPMRVDNDTLWKQTTYFPLQLFANHCRGVALDVYSSSDSYSTRKHRQVQYLDVSSTYEPDKKQIVVNVVNRHKDEPISTDILCQTGNLARTAVIHVVNGDDLKGTNSVDKRVVGIETQNVTVTGNTLTHAFEPHSFTQIIVGVNE